MQLTELRIRDFRNLVDVELEPCSGLNLISGPNASGKTSLLEAIFYLSYLRSFRTTNVSDLINHTARDFQLFAMAKDQRQKEIPIGILRGKILLEVRADHQEIKRVADMTAMLPVLAIHPDSYKLVTGSPSDRRSYLDWGVFHVEHGFYQAWQRYRKALSQRNAALRSGYNRAFCMAWDHELDSAAKTIDASRSRYVQNLKVHLNTRIDAFFPGSQVVIDYRSGWSRDQSLSAVLEETFDRDRRRGFTQAGPHRADLLIEVDGKSAQSGISRGQQKVLVALLRLTQLEQFTRATSRQCILLYDDLAAELDPHYRRQLLALLNQMPVQLFLTAIEPEQIDTGPWANVRRFHVEHGHIVRSER